VAADAVLAVVEDRPQAEGALEVTPAAFDLEELLVGRGQVFRGQGDVAGAQLRMTSPFGPTVLVCFGPTPGCVWSASGRVDAGLVGVGSVVF
jgi:hypothetical protein